MATGTEKKPKRKPSTRALKAAAIVANGGSKAAALRKAGFSPNTARTPDKVFGSESFQDVAERYLPNEKVFGVHVQLMDAHRLDHMTFPLGPIEDEEDDDVDLSIDEGKDLALAERTTLTDKEIKQLLLDVGCTVQRIVHGQTARHVYFWSPDNKARKDAVEMAYKLKGKLTPHGGGMVVPIQININEDREKYR